MRRLILLLPVAAVGLIFWFWSGMKPPAGFVSPLVVGVDYSPYTFEALARKRFPVGEITLKRASRQDSRYTSYLFTYLSEGKTVSGLANVPVGAGPFPVVVLLRGWADQRYYYTGLGTEKSADFLAGNGFLTLSPDFLGYGESDKEDPDILTARFTRPVAVLSLLASLPTLPQADSARVGLWGHSNGGQIALSILEITQKPYPTSLWAPVSLDFPENVLVYLGEEEVGNLVKEKIDEFALDNDPKRYSVGPYLARVRADFIVHQAGADPLIKAEWTQALVDRLRQRGLSVDYYLYPGENHNFNYRKTTGDLLRQRDLVFFRRTLGVP